MKQINDVELFWHNNPCGMKESYFTQDRKTFFLDAQKERYQKQPLIKDFADFGSYKGKKVLEIGCGIGIDGIQFARNGAFYTGVDLTDAAVNITKEQFGLFGESGEFLKINAEKLPFRDNYFDHVYSFGVIHHSAHPEKIVGEIHRVLKPGGTIAVMLYNRTSFYYILEVSIIRRIFFAICDKERLCRLFFSVFGKKVYGRFERFRKKLAEKKRLNSKPTDDEWISMNTDDVFCPIAKVYSRAEARKLFALFKGFNTTVWFIDKDNWFLWIALIRFMPGFFARWLEYNFGWFRMIQARK